MARGSGDTATLRYYYSDRHGDYDTRHGGGQPHIGELSPPTIRNRVCGSDGAIDARDVLLRSMRGRGDGRVGHDEQLLGICAGDGTAAEA